MNSSSQRDMASSFLLRSRVALVTASAQGIGAAVCHVLATRGGGIAVNYSASRDKVGEIVAHI